ncbi:MAG TPA: hypothetical protein VLZ54_11865, partial [Arenibacter sp.]|nr:hypothetical protein [Arenibacter sp.]
MILELPITSDSAQQFLTQLGNRKFSFEFKFNEVGSVWTMDIMDPLTNLPLLMGLPLLLGTELLN